MTRLIEAKHVRARLSLSDDEGVNDAIESAIDAALPKLKTDLKTQFDLGTATDLFFIDPDRYTPLDGMYALRASMGFLKPITVLFAAGETLAEVKLIAPTLVPEIIMAEKGFIKIPEEYQSKYILVSYSYGFDEFEDIPDWLMEVMITYTSKVLSVQQVGDKTKVMTDLYKFIELHGGGIMDGHLRVMNGSIGALG